MKFKYNGRIYNPVNVEKKLKKMGITIEDIEILSEEKIDNSLDDFILDRKQIIVRSTEDDIRRVCFVLKDKPLPTIKELFKNVMWNPKTKTGIKELTDDYLMTLYYER